MRKFIEFQQAPKGPSARKRSVPTEVVFDWGKSRLAAYAIVKTLALFVLTGEPPLLLISSGNLSTAALEKILCANLAGIEAAFATRRFVEITADALVIHE
jgi:hypothetical protein